MFPWEIPSTETASFPPGLRRLWDQRLMSCCQRTPVWKGYSTWKPVGAMSPNHPTGWVVWFEFMISKWSGYWLLDHAVDTQTCWVFHIKTDAFCITESMVEDSFPSSARPVPLIFFRSLSLTFHSRFPQSEHDMFFQRQKYTLMVKQKRDNRSQPQMKHFNQKDTRITPDWNRNQQKPGMSSRKLT